MGTDYSLHDWQGEGLVTYGSKNGYDNTINIDSKKKQNKMLCWEQVMCPNFATTLDVSAEGGPEGVTLLLQNSKCAAG